MYCCLGLSCLPPGNYKVFQRNQMLTVGDGYEEQDLRTEDHMGRLILPHCRQDSQF